MQQYEDQYRDEWLDEEPALITIREVVYNPLEAPTMGDTRLFSSPKPRRLYQVPLVMLLVLGLLILITGGVAAAAYSLLPEKEVYVVVQNESVAAGVAAAAVNGSVLSPIFTPEIQYWSQDIAKWAVNYNLDPNLIATVIQIESCGDPTVGSSAGAQGLFQVMPFHFAEGEAMLDVQTNAKRGLNYLSESLSKAQGNAGLAFAGYNGGHGVIDWGWARWPEETRRYFYWATGIYQDAISGNPTSTRLTEWLNAGGSYLCRQAASVQGALPRS